MVKECSLTQKGLFAGERVFEIKDGRYLFIQQKGVKLEKNYQIDLVALCPKSHSKVTVAWNWLIATSVALLILLISLFLLPQIFDIKAYALSLTIVLALVAFIFIIMFVSASYLEVVYEASVSRFPLVRFLTGKPDRKAFKAFKNNLEALIEQSSAHLDIEPQQRIAGEIKMLRRLVRYNVLSDKQYEQIKKRLLRKSGKY